MGINLKSYIISKKYIDRVIEDNQSPISSHPDWNENNPSKNSYIKNKPTALPASDVYDWAKQPTKPIYEKSEIELGNVDNTSDKDKPLSDVQKEVVENYHKQSIDYTDTTVSEIKGDNWNEDRYTLMDSYKENQELQQHLIQNETKISGCINKTDQLQSELNENILGINNSVLDLSSRLEKYRNFTTTQLNDSIEDLTNDLKDYINENLSTIEELFALNPDTMNREPLNDILQKMFAYLKWHKIQAQEYRQAQIPAKEYQQLQVTASDYDMKGRFYLGLFDWFYCRMLSPITEKQDTYKNIIDVLSTLYSENSSKITDIENGIDTYQTEIEKIKYGRSISSDETEPILPENANLLSISNNMFTLNHHFQIGQDGSGIYAYSTITYNKSIAIFNFLISSVYGVASTWNSHKIDNNHFFQNFQIQTNAAYDLGHDQAVNISQIPTNLSVLNNEGKYSFNLTRPYVAGIIKTDNNYVGIARMQPTIKNNEIHYILYTEVEITNDHIVSLGGSISVY